ncbi:hypothetical protein KIPB_004821 [Kipferlia bialata]|uniref:Uncharacterized protein n=1 Tax=Kipferlia bialata TaxID=797122 RepID=A0A9K3GGU2_9EUKA|nr:hypothetical protein KIPB_004821 [Kipferlia bialata]|eukprot:g4821.t1
MPRNATFRQYTEAPMHLTDESIPEGFLRRMCAPVMGGEVQGEHGGRVGVAERQVVVNAAGDIDRLPSLGSWIAKDRIPEVLNVASTLIHRSAPYTALQATAGLWC